MKSWLALSVLPLLLAGGAPPPIRGGAKGGGIQGPSPLPYVEERIAEGVVLGGLELGGRTVAEAEPLVRELADRKLAVPILLRAPAVSGAPGRSARRTPRELGATCDVAAALAAARAADEQGGFFQRLQARLPLLGGKQVPLPLRLDAKACEDRLLRVTRGWSTSPREPRLKWVGERIATIPGRSGYRLNASETRAALEAVLARDEWQEAAAKSVTAGEIREAWLRAVTPLAVDLKLEARSPRVGTADLAAVTTELARFSTHFRAGERNRAHNIRLACRAIDGTVLLPGETFSYNETVGPRTQRTGFRIAPQIVDGELVPGIGGGVCQVSTTLYNAALLADLGIVRRNHHQFPVHYVPPGRDATVAYPYLDLRFRNRLSKPIAIHLTAEGSHVVARVFGAPDCRREVRLLRTGIGFLPAQTVRQRDYSLKAGRRVVERRARRGQRVTLIRMVRTPGGSERRETVSRDLYRPAPGIVRVGARRPAPPPRPSEPAPVAASPAPVVPASTP